MPCALCCGAPFRVLGVKDAERPGGGRGNQVTVGAVRLVDIPVPEPLRNIGDRHVARQQGRHERVTRAVGGEPLGDPHSLSVAREDLQGRSCTAGTARHRGTGSRPGDPSPSPTHSLAPERHGIPPPCGASAASSPGRSAPPARIPAASGRRRGSMISGRPGLPESAARNRASARS